MIIKYTIAWIPMVFIAIVNGTIRQLGYGKFMSELTAHQISCFTGVALFFLYTLFLAGIWPLKKSNQTLVVGVIWLFLTIAFEFVLGHYITHLPWDKLFQDYNIHAGRLWPLVLFSVALMSYVVYRIRCR